MCEVSEGRPQPLGNKGSRVAPLDQKAECRTTAHYMDGRLNKDRRESLDVKCSVFDYYEDAYFQK